MTETVKIETYRDRYDEIERLAESECEDEGEDSFNIGVRDGFSEAVALIDRLTGGDGEYRYCTNHEPDRHCPDPAAMIAKIVSRLATQPDTQAVRGDFIEFAPAFKTINPKPANQGVACGTFWYAEGWINGQRIEFTTQTDRDAAEVLCTQLNTCVRAALATPQPRPDRILELERDQLREVVATYIDRALLGTIREDLQQAADRAIVWATKKGIRPRGEATLAIMAEMDGSQPRPDREAIARERERCARIAESMVPSAKWPWTGGNVRDRIATAIRKGVP